MSEITKRTATLIDHIVDTASALFYREGTQSIGVDRIIAETGVAKATMYRHFTGKDALIAACLRRRHDNVLTALRDGLARVRGDGRKRVLTVFELLYDKAESPDFRGCGFLLAVAENEGSDEVRAIARHHKATVLALFAELLPAGIAKRDALAAQLNLLYDGAMAQILIHRDPGPARIARECARRLLA